MSWDLPDGLSQSQFDEYWKCLDDEEPETDEEPSYCDPCGKPCLEGTQHSADSCYLGDTFQCCLCHYEVAHQYTNETFEGCQLCSERLKADTRRA